MNVLSEWKIKKGESGHSPALSVFEVYDHSFSGILATRISITMIPMTTITTMM